MNNDFYIQLKSFSFLPLPVLEIRRDKGIGAIVDTVYPAYIGGSAKPQRKFQILERSIWIDGREYDYRQFENWDQAKLKASQWLVSLSSYRG